MATGRRKKAEGKALGEAKEKVNATPLMYVGPTMHKIGVIKNTIYTAIPETAEKAIEEKQILKTLFIRVEQYPEAERSIREESGYFWTAYKAALEYLEILKRR